MEQKQVSIEEVYHKLLLLERTLRAKGIISDKESSEMAEDDEGELTDEFKARLEKARKTPLFEYINHEEVKRKILAKKK